MLSSRSSQPTCPKGCHWSDEFRSKYTIGKQLGYGAYGCVHEGVEISTNKNVAIKKITNFTNSATEAKRLLREISLLRMVKGHPNLISLDYVATSATQDKFNEIDLVFERYDADLHHVIRTGQGSGTQHVQYFLYQILCGIYFLHSAQLVHRDLKPSNILVKGNCDLKICDFGLSRALRTVNSSGDLTPPRLFRKLTGYIMTRWYRSPEVILRAPAGPAADMWSIGCIMAELMLGKAIFRGDKEVEVLEKIFELLGTPSAEDCAHLINDVNARNYAINHPPLPRQNFKKIFPADTDPSLLALLEQLLVFNPAKRISAEKALHLPLFHDFFRAEDIIRFSSKQLSAADESSLRDYYQFETKVDGQSIKYAAEQMKWTCALIKAEIERYKPTASASSTSSLAPTLSHEPSSSVASSCISYASFFSSNQKASAAGVVPSAKNNTSHAP